MKTLVGKLCVAGMLVGLIAVGALAAERARRERVDHGKALQQIEQQIRAGRLVTKRIERDRRASADIKQKAVALDQTLETRERLLTKLDALYRDFVSQHKSELDELADLRKRALAIDTRLGEARDTLVQANKADFDELKRSSLQAKELADGLRSAYEIDRRTRRQ